MFPNVGLILPEIVVVPENVIALEAREDVALLIKFPFRLIVFEPATKLPFESVKTPLIVMPDIRFKMPVPVLDKFAKAVELLGSSGPVLIEPEV